MGHSENLPVSRPNFPIGMAFSEPCCRCGAVVRVVALREADGLVCADCALAAVEEEPEP